MIKLGEKSGHLLHARNTAVRNGDALPHAGGAQLLALGERFVDAPLGESGETGRLMRHLLQHLLLARSLQMRNDRVGRKQIGDFHDVPCC